MRNLTALALLVLCVGACSNKKEMAAPGVWIANVIAEEFVMAKVEPLVSRAAPEVRVRYSPVGCDPATGKCVQEERVQDLTPWLKKTLAAASGGPAAGGEPSCNDTCCKWGERQVKDVVVLREVCFDLNLRITSLDVQAY